MSDIPIEQLRQLLRYEPETGKLYWLERPVEMFRDSATNTAESVCKWWNGRFAGKEAFTATGVENCRAGRIFGKSHYAHRVGWALHHGEWPADDIDHEDGVRSNNRISNLRIAGHGANMKNKKLYKSNASGCHGVTFHKRYQRWQAYISIDGKRLHLGTFVEVEAAIAARQLAQQEIGVFHQNHGRAA